MPTPFEYGDIRSSDAILTLRLKMYGIDDVKALTASCIKHGTLCAAKPCPPASVPRNKELIRKQAQLNVTIAGLL